MSGRTSQDSQERIRDSDARERLYLASQWQLVYRKFKRHRLATVGTAVLAVLYVVSAFAEFISPYDILERSKQRYSPPSRIRLVDEGGRFHLRPFVYGMVFSRTVYAARVSLSIALVGVAFSFVLGCMPGGISGYFGSKTDVVIQRTIEIFMSLPHIPLWIALAAALPREWPVIKTYFAITVILSLISLREEEFVLAARISGMRSGAIIVRHLLPSFMSYLVVNLTLAVPSMILGETALSFMGLGIRPPAVSWGALLKAAQQVNVVALYPWLLIPGLLVIVTVLAFKFLGDGLRAAADPYR